MLAKNQTEIFNSGSTVFSGKNPPNLFKELFDE